MANVPFNYSKLKGRAREKGMTLEKIHEETGISISSLSDKWNGKRFFKKLLDLESVDAYFFAE